MWAKISTFAIFELHQRDVPQKNTFFMQNSITNSKCKVCFNKSEKNWIFSLLSQNWRWPVVFGITFFKCVPGNLKNDFTKSCKKVWDQKSSKKRSLTQSS